MWYVAYFIAWIVQGIFVGSTGNVKLWKALGISLSTMLIALICKYGL